MRENIGYLTTYVNGIDAHALAPFGAGRMGMIPAATVSPKVRDHALRMLDDAWCTYARKVHNLRPASGRPVAICGVSADGIGLGTIALVIRELERSTDAKRHDLTLLRSVTRQWPALPAIPAEQSAA